MRQKGLGAIAIVVIVAIVVGLILYKMRRSFLPPAPATGTMQEQPTSLENTSSTDEQLSKDDQLVGQSVSAVDNQVMKIDQGLNDQPDNFQ